jgi:hypothetical protein
MLPNASVRPHHWPPATTHLAPCRPLFFLSEIKEATRYAGMGKSAVQVQVKTFFLFLGTEACRHDPSFTSPRLIGIFVHTFSRWLTKKLCSTLVTSFTTPEHQDTTVGQKIGWSCLFMKEETATQNSV